MLTIVVTGTIFGVCTHKSPFQESMAAAEDAGNLPDAAAQEQARKAIREQYKADFNKAKKPEARVELAKTFLETAAATDDRTTRFALFEEALQLAGQGSDLDLALRSANLIADEFNVAALPWKERAAVTVGASTLNVAPDIASRMLARFSELAAEASAADEYAIAANVMKAATDVFKKPAYKPFKDEASIQAKQYANMRDVYDAAKVARDKLATDPDNTAANLAWGRFLCFYKQDWDHGLPFLSKGNDKVWSPLAQRELMPPDSADDWLQLGDDWYSAALKENYPMKLVASERAERAWRQAISKAATPMQKKELEQKFDQRLVKLFGTSVVSTRGDVVGATIPGSDRLSPTDSFTIEFWVSTTATKGTLISKRHLPNESSILVHLDKAVPNLSIVIPGRERGSGAGATINDGAWHHIAMVKKANDLALFVDGKKYAGNVLEEKLVSNSPWKFGTSQDRVPCAAKFGGIRISKTARYLDSFTPKVINSKDKDTLLP